MIHALLNSATAVSYFLIGWYLWRISQAVPWSATIISPYYVTMAIGFSQFIAACGAHHACLAAEQFGMDTGYVHDYVMLYMTLVSIATCTLVVANKQRIARDLYRWFEEARKAAE